MPDPLTNRQIAELSQPFYSVFGHAFQMAWRDVKAVVPIIGIPKKTERANVMHAALRERLQAVCDEIPMFMKLVAEVDGQGLDYVILNPENSLSPDLPPFAIRWGKDADNTIRRNRTQRTRYMQTDGMITGDQTYLFDTPAGVTVDRDEMSVATLRYSVDREYVELGRPCWHMTRVALVRERYDGNEFIEEVAVFPEPQEQDPVYDEPSPRVVAREEEMDEMRRLIVDLRHRFGT